MPDRLQLLRLGRGVELISAAAHLVPVIRNIYKRDCSGKEEMSLEVGCLLVGRSFF